MNHIGKGGKTMNDRELAARVRTLTLNEIEKVLTKKRNKKLYEAVLIRLAGTVLPRLNEHSGPDGEPIPLLNYINNGTLRDHNIHQEDTEANQEDKSN